MLHKILLNGYRLILCLSYPLLIASAFFFIYKNDRFKPAIKKQLKQITVNTLIIAFVAAVCFWIFFYFEDFIYDYDYVGHWYRALSMKERFFINPLSIPGFLHNSLNNDIFYTYLIAFLEIPVVMINETMGFFCYGNFLWFYIPVFVLLQILYFTYFDKYKYLPVFIGFVFYQMYFPVLCGETECFGSFLIITALMLTIFTDFKEITMADNLYINLLIYVLIFGRRFYLYAAVMIYLCYFIHYLKEHNFKVFNKDGIIDFLKILSSGIILLIICIVFYRPFFLRAINNNYAEAYAYNNKPGKLLGMIKMFSIPIIAVSIYGLYKNTSKEKLVQNVELILLLVVPTALFWQVQNFEYHHYYLISFTVIVYFAIGLYYLLESGKKTLNIILCVYLVVQVGTVFITNDSVAGFLTYHKAPKVYPKKDQVISFVDKLEELCSDGSYIYLASGDGLLNYSVFENAKLPQLPKINFQVAVNEIIDGFPSEMKNCRYVIISEPTLHQNWDYQSMYDIITYAIENAPVVKSQYTLIYEQKVNYINFKVYELTGKYTDEIKAYYYEKMTTNYPDKTDFFKNILD